MELLRVTDVVHAGIRSLIGPNLTEKERETTWMGIRPFADPPGFGHADVMSSIVLYFVVFFVYAVLAPITSIFMFLCFLLFGSAYRHQVSLGCGHFVPSICAELSNALLCCP